MKRKRPIRGIVWFALVLTAFVLLCLFEPTTRATFSPYQWSEGAGRRQYDYHYLGFIPYSKVVPDPSLHTARDLSEHFAKARIKFAPGYAPTDEGAQFAISHYTDGDSSTLYFTNVKDPTALYAFYRSQAVGKVWEHKDGDAWVSTWKTPGGDDIQVSYLLGRDPGTGRVKSESVSVSVRTRQPRVP